MPGDRTVLYLVTTTIPSSILDADLLAASDSLWRVSEEFFRRMNYGFRRRDFRGPFFALLPENRFVITRASQGTLYGRIAKDGITLEGCRSDLPDVPPSFVDLIGRAVSGTLFSRSVGAASALLSIDTLVHFAPRELYPATMADLAKEYRLQRLEPIIYHPPGS